MHSHHSHSGQYVQHAKDQLDDIVARVCELQFDVFCLTEHMPRYRQEDLYPEELASNTTPVNLIMTFERYYQHALEIKETLNKRRALEKASGSAKTPLILVGFECEGFSETYLEHVENVIKSHKFDMFVGSIHHVHGIPIDFDQESFHKAAQISLERSKQANGSPNELTELAAYHALLCDYYDLQYEMIRRLTPPVLGHLDLIALFAPPELQALPLQSTFPDVWARVVRNVRYAAGYSALFEVNSAALRKGWSTPYPGREIAELIIQEGGKFCLSDDSHGIAQVGQNYGKAVEYLRELGVENLYYLSLKSDDDPDVPEVLNRTVTKQVSLKEVAAHPFFSPK